MLLCQNFRNDFSRFFEFSFHFGNKFQLRAATHEVVPLVLRGKIGIARKIIGKKPHAAFYRHQIGAVRQQLRFLCRNRTAHRAHIPLGVRLEIFHAEMHFVKVFFVLGGGGSPEADGIAEVVQHRTGHNRIEVDHRARFVRRRVH